MFTKKLGVIPTNSKIQVSGYKSPTATTREWYKCLCRRKDKKAASDRLENRRTLKQTQALTGKKAG